MPDPTPDPRHPRLSGRRDPATEVDPVHHFGHGSGGFLVVIAFIVLVVWALRDRPVIVDRRRKEE
jgi:hypothetical protein